MNETIFDYFLSVSLVELLRREQTSIDLAVEAVVILGSLARGKIISMKSERQFNQ
jgi:hypothetical protein